MKSKYLKMKSKYYGKKNYKVDKKREIDKKRCIECRRMGDDVRWDNEAGGYVCHACWVKLYV